MGQDVVGQNFVGQDVAGAKSLGQVVMGQKVLGQEVGHPDLRCVNWPHGSVTVAIISQHKFRTAK